MCLGCEIVSLPTMLAMRYDKDRQGRAATGTSMFSLPGNRWIVSRTKSERSPQAGTSGYKRVQANVEELSGADQSAQQRVEAILRLRIRASVSETLTGSHTFNGPMSSGNPIIFFCWK